MRFLLSLSIDRIAIKYDRNLSVYRSIDLSHHIEPHLSCFEQKNWLPKDWRMNCDGPPGLSSNLTYWSHGLSSGLHCTGDRPRCFGSPDAKCQTPIPSIARRWCGPWRFLWLRSCDPRVEVWPILLVKPVQRKTSSFHFIPCCSLFETLSQTSLLFTLAWAQLRISKVVPILGLHMWWNQWLQNRRRCPA